MGGQQHGMVCLDADGEVIRPALLWNDTRSAAAADDLVAELGDGDATLGARRWAEAVGWVPVASFTITKLRWLADHEPENAARVAAVALPQPPADLASLRSRLARHARDRPFRCLGTATGPPTSATDATCSRSRCAGLKARPSGWCSPACSAPARPPAGHPGNAVLGPGCGDNAGAALGLDSAPARRSSRSGPPVSWPRVLATPTHDRTGGAAGFADATGAFLLLACTLNGSRILDATRRLLGVGHEELSDLALAAPDGADGLVLVPYLEGERTPDFPGHGVPARADAGHDEPGPSRRGPGSRGCCASWPTRSTFYVHGSRSTGSPWCRRRRAVPCGP